MTRPGSGMLVWLVVAAWPFLAARAAVVPYQVDKTQTFLAVITHPAGAAAGFGHSHLISAPAYRAELAVDDAQLTASRFRVTVAASELAVDAPEITAALVPRLRLLGLVNAGIPRLSAEEENATRENMLSPGQLDAKEFPEIEARIEGLRREPTAVGEREFSWVVDLALTVRGKTVTRAVSADILYGNGRMRATAVGAFRFSDFGIEPYRAALGLLQNDNKFHMYVELTAMAE